MNREGILNIISALEEGRPAVLTTDMVPAFAVDATKGNEQWGLRRFRP